MFRVATSHSPSLKKLPIPLQITREDGGMEDGADLGHTHGISTYIWVAWEWEDGKAVRF